MVGSCGLSDPPFIQSRGAPAVGPGVTGLTGGLLMLLGGVLGEMIGLRATLMVAGVGLLLPTVWLFFSPIRAMRMVDYQAEDEISA